MFNILFALYLYITFVAYYKYILMMITGKFPSLRLRRNRKNDWSRRLVEENNLTPNDFILPIFLIDGKNKKQSVKSMPGVYRYSLDKICLVVDKAIKIDGQGGGSGAQEVITVTTFALALLQRSSIDFPMIIDHPVKDIQNENRGELSKFLKKSTHQCICLVINSEKDGFIRDEDTRKKHDHVANSKFITAARKRNAGDFPKDSLESEDGIVTYDYEFFNSFKTSKE